MADSEPVLYEILTSDNGYKVAIATLNAERSLNALTLDMVRSLSSQLALWAEDKSVACVMLRGAGDKAFCAGGDVVKIYKSLIEGEGISLAEEFFSEEYRLDYAIHTYPKPIIVWGNGYVMGGGLGLMGGASHRIATETTRIAMPEITIGLFPDVGGTYLLNNAPDNTGLFLGLTGSMINAADAIFVRFADKVITHQYYTDVIKSLRETNWIDTSLHRQVDAVLNKYAELSTEAIPLPQLSQNLDYIKKATSKDSINEIVEFICSYSGEDKWLKKAAQTLSSGCPTTMKLVDQQLTRGKELSLPDIFRMELVMAVNCAIQPNFPEGVRALLVDKDKEPKFSPANLDEITDEYINSHFVSLWPDTEHPLQDL